MNMMTTPFDSNNIFSIPIGGYLGADMDAYQLIYAPIAGKIILSDRKGLVLLPNTLSSLSDSECSDNHMQPSKKVGAYGLTKMAILPNHACNFNCAYCYSARGRSNISLNVDILDKALDFFINPQRLQERTLNLTYIGGGEPLLSWPLVKHGIEYAHHLANLHGFILQTTLTTNGSIMNEDIIHTLKKYNVFPNVSFDILEDVQNKNRKHFEQVCQTLDLLCLHDVIPIIIATITPDTVCRMEEMFDYMDKRFPLIKVMSFEPVISTEIFDTAQSLGSFYDSFLKYFYLTRKRAQEKEKSITCRIFRNVDSILDRGCPSKFTLTPQGDLTICYCVSSPNEDNYAKRVFGKVNPDGVWIDEASFQRINGINVHSFNKCEKCFAKWHCAGGCMCANDRYDEDHLQEVCRYTKEMVRRALIEKALVKYQIKDSNALLNLLDSEHILM